MKKSVIAIALFSMLGMSSANAAMVSVRPMTVSAPAVRPVTVSRPATQVSTTAVHTNTAANVVTTMMLMNALNGSDTATQVENGTDEEEIICDETVSDEECAE